MFSTEQRLSAIQRDSIARRIQTAILPAGSRGSGLEIAAATRR
jgi:hypothetical protein